MLPKFHLPTYLISFGIAGAAYFTAPHIAGINSIILGLFLGILVGNLLKLPSKVNSTLSSLNSSALEYSILFLAFSINYRQLGETGGKAIVMVILMILALLVISAVLMKLFKCKPSTAWLISFGTAICGSSAIAALAPSVSKDKEEAGISIAVVNLLGTLGMVVLPFAFMQLDLGAHIEGLYIGGSLHSVGNVAGAAYSMGNEVGELALTVKLARVAMLSPALIILHLAVNRDKTVHWTKQIKLPWYLLGFIAISLVNSFVALPEQVSANLNLIGKLLLTVAMVGIGLKMSIRTLFTSGRKGLSYGLVLFIIQLAILTGLIALLF